MLLKYLLIAFSFALGLFGVRLLRRYDIHEQEPVGVMFSVTVWGGIVAAFLTAVIYGVLELLGIEPARHWLDPFLVIGPVEESAKLAAFGSTYLIFRRELDEPTDGIIYMACVALGFSLVENYHYAVALTDSRWVFFLRLVVCTPLHILFSAWMGLAFYMVVRAGARRRTLLYAWLYASLVHGAYDALILNEAGLVLLGILVLLSISWLLDLLEYSTATSPHRQSLRDFIASREDPPVEPGLECIHCGSTGQKASYRLGRIRFQKCDRCEAYVSTRDSLYRMFRHFAAALRGLASGYRPAGACEDGGEGNTLTAAGSVVAATGAPAETPRPFATLVAGNFISEEKKLAAFFLDEMDAALERRNVALIERREAGCIFRTFWV